MGFAVCATTFERQVGSILGSHFMGKSVRERGQVIVTMKNTEDVRLRVERVKLELGARMEEYKALRAEMLEIYKASYQTTGLTLTGAGGLIVGAPFLLQTQRPVLFIVVSLVFYGLAWVQLRYAISIHNVSKSVLWELP